MKGYFTQVWDNVLEGEAGKRGETFVAAQLGALFVAAVGDLPGIPLVALLQFMLGPVVALVGAAVIAASVVGLGRNISPWPAPVADNDLRTLGIYGRIRHPMFVGTALFAAGQATMGRSVPRLLAAGVLALVLRLQAAVEDEALLDRHGRMWSAYAATVPPFVPKELSWERIQGFLRRT